jgi:hypothetical protein
MKKIRIYIVCVIVTFAVSCMWGGQLRAQSQQELEEQLQSAKEKYDYANWAAETGKVIAGVNISTAVLPHLQGMTEKWPDGDFSIDTAGTGTYAKIRQWWTAADRQLQITMVVCPTPGAAREYLISYYAHTQMSPLAVKPSGHRQGLNTGNICFATPARQGGGFLDIDFIRRNVLIMMRAEGGFCKELAAAAGTLDHLLARKKTWSHYPAIAEMPVIKNFSCETAAIKRGETVLLNLEAVNPCPGKLRYIWDLTGGGVEKNPRGDFVYYGGEAGIHTITLTVLNEAGLFQTETVEIEVIK